jgi:tryptophan synthase beta chain
VADNPSQSRRFGDSTQTRPLFEALAKDYARVRAIPQFFVDREVGLVRCGVRPTPLVLAQGLSDRIGGARIFLKREDLVLADAHLIACAAGQASVAKALGRTRVVAGIRSMRWGLALASAAVRYGLKADIYMEKDELSRHAAAVFQMQLMGAEIHGVVTRYLRNHDLREAALEEWLKDPGRTFLFMGFDGGPEPYPSMIGDLMAMAGRECRRQVTAQIQRLPDVVVARGGANADAISIFPAFIEDRATRLVSVEPDDAAVSFADLKAGSGPSLDQHAKDRARLKMEGLEYPSIDREQARLGSSGRLTPALVESEPAMRAITELARTEGIITGLQTGYALAWVCEEAKQQTRAQAIVLMVAEQVGRDILDLARLQGLQAPPAKGAPREKA